METGDVWELLVEFVNYRLLERHHPPFQKDLNELGRIHSRRDYPQTIKPVKNLSMEVARVP